jgi:hypothetical protein
MEARDRVFKNIKWYEKTFAYAVIIMSVIVFFRIMYIIMVGIRVTLGDTFAELFLYMGWIPFAILAFNKYDKEINKRAEILKRESDECEM